MQADIYQPWLMNNVETVLTAVKNLNVADTNRIAILGHSMGTAAALGFAQTYPIVRATVAVSPVETKVTPELPQNLLLLAGEWEPRFVANAQARLREAGGAGGDFNSGTARRLQVLPGLEHISIIFAPITHALALDWLDQTFGTQEQAKPYSDKRLLWFLLIITGTMSLATLLPQPHRATSEIPQISLQRGLLVMLISTVSATLLLWFMTQAGFSVTTLLGLRTGGYLVVWFLLAGIFGLLILKTPIPRPNSQELITALFLFTILWLGIGLVGGAVWLPWLLISQRLLLYPLVVLALMPWYYFVGILGSSGGAKARLGWWAISSLFICLMLLLAINITSELGFLILLLPLFPLIFLFHAVPTMKQQGSWSFALSGSLFLGWMTLAVFPLI